MPPRSTASHLQEHLTDAQLDELIAHPYWESLGVDIDGLIAHVPQSTERAERTTILTWIYSQQGVATFEELSAKLTGLASLPKRKKHLRQALRAMEKLFLVSIVNFPGDDEDAPEPDEDVVGKNSLVSLTWTGMLWMRRAWAARRRPRARSRRRGRRGSATRSTPSSGSIPRRPPTRSSARSPRPYS